MAERGATLRLALFCDSNSPISIELAEAAVRAAASRTDVSIVALCDATRGRVRSGLERTGTEFLKCLVKGLFDSRHAALPARGYRTSLARVAKRGAVPILRPPAGDVNSPHFVELLLRECGANGVLALGCVAILRPALLAALPCAVNYHNSLLPAYAGLRATRWEMYHRETVCGFTYHYITPGIDAGAVLIQARLALPEGATRRAVEAGKTREAARRLPELLDRMVAREPGTPQAGAGSYFGIAEWRGIRAVDDAAKLDYEELQHRLRCFDVLRIRIGANTHDVTRLRRVRRAGPRSFRTRDGVLVAVARYNYLPGMLDRLRRSP
jgi:hypothetical protein